MNAVKEAFKANVPDSNLIFRKTSSVCTDGTNLNTGEKNGLWALLEGEIKKSGSKIPLTKIWCAAHRAELAWKSASRSVKEVSKVLKILSEISTHFHFSAICTSELKKIASEHGLTALNLPKIFEIRWSQFTYNLVFNVLKSWNALVVYFQKK